MTQETTFSNEEMCVIHAYREVCPDAVPKGAAWDKMVAASRLPPEAAEEAINRLLDRGVFCEPVLGVIRETEVPLPLHRPDPRVGLVAPEKTQEAPAKDETPTRAMVPAGQTEIAHDKPLAKVMAKIPAAHESATWSVSVESKVRTHLGKLFVETGNTQQSDKAVIDAAFVLLVKPRSQRAERALMPYQAQDGPGLNVPVIKAFALAADGGPPLSVYGAHRLAWAWGLIAAGDGLTPQKAAKTRGRTEAFAVPVYFGDDYPTALVSEDWLVMIAPRILPDLAGEG